MKFKYADLVLVSPSLGTRLFWPLSSAAGTSELGVRSFHTEPRREGGSGLGIDPDLFTKQKRSTATWKLRIKAQQRRTKVNKGN